MKHTLRADELRKELNYDPVTGIFTRKISNTHRIRVGQLAGTPQGRYGYLTIMVLGRLYLAQQLAFLYMTGDWAKRFVAHKNRIAADNRWENLEERDDQGIQEQRTKPSKNNPTKILGVTMKRGKYLARIRKENGLDHIGVFDTAEEAQAAYQAAKKLHYSESA